MILFPLLCAITHCGTVRGNTVVPFVTGAIFEVVQELVVIFLFFISMIESLAELFMTLAILVILEPLFVFI